MKKSDIKAIVEELERLYPDAGCSLPFKEPLQLMIATQLAAQCTDARVEIVTETLYQKYKTVDDFANADLKEFEQEIKSTGFYHNKARNIINACKMIISDFGGKVPSNMDDLLKLPGVGRKTANLVLGDLFDTPGIVVDTHATRLSNRFGMTKEKDPVKIEFALMKLIPKDKWVKFCHALVLHGRAYCNARKPNCQECPIRSHCDYGKASK